jgi:regulator of nucleoside diphosphate kinase
VRNRNIIISSADRDRLFRLIDSARLDRRIPIQSLDLLEGELARASIVEPQDLPRDVVAMNSSVSFRDLESGEIEHYTLVFPPSADVIRDRISVLAPIGTALLGFRLHDIVEWSVPQGHRLLEIVKVEQNSPTYDHEQEAVPA